MRRLPAADTSSFESSSESEADEEHTFDSITSPGSSLLHEAKPHLPTMAQHCVVLLRGVVWKSEEVEVMKLWQQLLRFWPVTFADSLVTPAGALKAHGGTCGLLKTFAASTRDGH